MATFSADFNLGDFFKNLDALTNVTVELLQKGVFLQGEALRGDSMNMAPFDKGTAGGLISTANTTDPRLNGDNVECQVGYNKEYAVKVHEDMTLKIRQKNTVAGQVRAQKYLERPMRENAEKYGKILADFLLSHLT